MPRVAKNKLSFQKREFTLNILLIIIIILLLLSILRVPEMVAQLITKINPPPPPRSDFGYPEFINIEKPVIYLYPIHALQTVSVRLDFNGKINSSYPTLIDNTWHVIANPDGTLVDSIDKSEYKYLFWDGSINKNIFNVKKGFVVPGNKTKQFFKEKLPQLGLIPSEYNDFIDYWSPEMEKNKYNMIYFAHSEYTDNAKLTIIPTPQTLIRVLWFISNSQNR